MAASRSASRLAPASTSARISSETVTVVGQAVPPASRSSLIMRVVGDGVALVLGIPLDGLGLHVAIPIHAHHGAVIGDRLLGAVAQKIEHMVDRVLEVQRALAVVLQLELVPEVFFFPVAIPVAADEIRVAVQRVARPLR